MNIYSQFDSKIPTLKISELRELTTQLGYFIKLYKKEVYISNEEDYEVLNVLSNIHNKLVNHQFDDLINDTSIIIND